MKDQLKKLDKLIARGEIMNAFEKYFAEDVTTHSDAGDESVGKAQKREFLQGFFGNMHDTNRITLHGNIIDGDTSYSSFTFEFTNLQGENLVWNEIIQRKWKDNLVVDEYYSQQNFEEIKHSVSQRHEIEKGRSSKVKAAKKEKSSSKIKEVPNPDVNQNIKKEVEKPIKPATKEPKVSKSMRAAKSDNLRKVEGIGPKIEELLKAANIATFKDLSKAKINVLEKVLENAGPRFRMHSPETWPLQAKLLADGKMDELAKLQDELKGGRTN